MSPLCDVCERVNSPPDKTTVHICALCGDPKRVRIFHQCCGLRLDLSIHEARILLQKAGLDIWRTGIILRFKECPDCAKDEVLSPDIFTINVPDSELEFFHAAVA